MDVLESGRRPLAVTLFVFVVVSSGCISNSSENLDQSFETDTTPVELNQSGEELLQDSFKQNYSSYDVDAKSQLLLNTPVSALTMNLSTNGSFRPDSSELVTKTKIGLGAFSDVNESEFPVKNITTSGNTSRVTITGEESSSKTVEAFMREEMGLSIEALREIEVEDSELLGATGEDDDQLLVEVDADSEDLVENYEDILTVNSVSDEETQDSSEDIESFNRSKTYAWVDRTDRALERYSYFGSDAEGNLQFRVDASFEK